MHTEAIPQSQRAVRLLTAVVALLSVLVVGLAGAAALLAREYLATRRAVSAALGGDGSLAELVDEMTQRQRAAAAQLVANGKENARQVAEFERRAASLRSQGGGPIDAAKKAVGIAELMLDQSTFALKQTSAFHDVLAKGVRPLPAQREALADGDGRAVPPPSER